MTHTRTRAKTRRNGIPGGTVLRAVWLIAAMVFAAMVLTPHSAQAQSYRFSQVEVQGNQRVDAASILSYAGLRRGAETTAGELNAAYQRISDSGLFETIELRPQGSTLIIVVQEFPTINVIAFEGNKRLSDEDLTPLIRSAPRRVYSPAQAETDAALLTEGYRQQGRIAATVVPKIIRRSDNRVDLVFEITEGKVAEIERLSFVGNRNYSDRRLRRVLETKQAGLFRAFIRADTLLEDRIAFDRQLLTDFYQSRGYIDFQVLSATPELVRERNAFLLTINVREGQQFRVGEVTVSSEIASIDPEAYRRNVKLRSGVVYSPTLIEADIARLERLAVRDSENFVRVEPRITRNDRSLTLDVEFHLSRGPRVFVERIDIEGNTATLDRVVRREFNVVEGDAFNPREVRAAAERIRALGYFNDTQVNSRQGSASDQVIIDVDVEEAPTGSLGFGANYSTNDGFGFTISFAERNFLGRGQALSFDLSTTASRANVGFSFVEPRFLGRDVALGLNASWRESDNDNARFNTKRGQFTPALSFNLSESVRLSLRAGIEYGEVFGVDYGFPDDSDDATDTGSSFLLRTEDEAGGYQKYSAGYTLTYDSRVTGLDPTVGFLLSLSQDFGIRDDDASFVRTEVLGRARKAIFNEEVTLRAEFEAGALVYSGGDSSVIERFSLNNKLRGFTSNGVGPRDLAVTNEDALGGNFYAVARFEADFPLGLPEEYGITGGLFYDVGSVWGLDNVNGGPSGTDEVDDGFNLRSAAGFSLFWDTALGPLRFNFSRALQKEDYDEEQNFEFTVSTRF